MKEFLYSSRRRVLWRGDKVGIVRLDAFKTSKEIQFAVQSGPLLMENGVINPRIHPNVASRKIRNGVGINKHGNAVFC